MTTTLNDPSDVLIFGGGDSHDLPYRREAPSISPSDKYTCKLSGRANYNASAKPKVVKTIASYLTGLAYNDDDIFAGTLKKILTKELEVLRISFWNTLTCHLDHGGHQYRVESGIRNLKARDQSWIKVSRAQMQAPVVTEKLHNHRRCVSTLNLSIVRRILEPRMRASYLSKAMDGL